jgi:glutamyl-tRNA synthetase
MEHGQSVARRMGLTVSADTFNPVIVDFYEQVGYLPEAILNYLLLLGWSLDDKTEDFTREEMLQHFSIDRVNKAPASFDPEKLVAFQSRAMQRLPIKQKVAKAVPFLQKAGFVATPPACDTAPLVTPIVTAAADRIKVAGDILDYDEFFVADDKFVYDPAAVERRITKPSGAIELLAKFRAALADVEPFTAERLEPWMHEWVAAAGIKIGDIVHAVRVAVTGKAVGFGLFDTLAILGKEKCLARIDRALAIANQTKP